MSTKVQKWGNSLAVRLPRELVSRFGLEAGTSVTLSPARRGIMLKPKGKKELTLRELVRRITPQNRHPETQWGRPRGREIW